MSYNSNIDNFTTHADDIDLHGSSVLQTVFNQPAPPSAAILQYPVKKETHEEDIPSSVPGNAPLLTAEEEQSLGRKMEIARIGMAYTLPMAPGLLTTLLSRGEELLSFAATGIRLSELFHVSQDNTDTFTNGTTTAAANLERFLKIQSAFDAWSRAVGNESQDSVDERIRSLQEALIEANPTSLVLNRMFEHAQSLLEDYLKADDRLLEVCTTQIGMTQREYLGYYPELSSQINWPDTIRIHEKDWCLNWTQYNSEFRKAHTELVQMRLSIGTDVDTLEDIVAKAKRLQKDFNAGLDTMVKSNLRLVYSVARRYKGGSMPFHDMVQEGNIGLMRAAERFDASLGLKFSTYATWWIRQGITRALADKGHTVRLPVYVHDNIRIIKRVESELLQDDGSQPTDEAIADRCGLPVKTVRKLRKGSNTCSLNTPIGEEDNLSMMDLMEGDEQYEPEALSQNETLKDSVQKLLTILRERDALVVCLRHGIGTGDPRTLDEVSDIMGISRERVRQLEVRALDKLKKYMERNELKMDDFF